MEINQMLIKNKFKDKMIRDLGKETATAMHILVLLF